MLYVPWRKEEDIKGSFGSYEEAFRAKSDEVKWKMATYEPMSAVLESVDEELQQEAHKHDQSLLPPLNTKMTIQGDTDPSASHDLAFREPSTLHQFDIGPFWA